MDCMESVLTNHSNEAETQAHWLFTMGLVWKVGENNERIEKMSRKIKVFHNFFIRHKAKLYTHGIPNLYADMGSWTPSVPRTGLRTF